MCPGPSTQSAARATVEAATAFCFCPGCSFHPSLASSTRSSASNVTTSSARGSDDTSSTSPWSHVAGADSDEGGRGKEGGAESEEGAALAEAAAGSMSGVLQPPGSSSTKSRKYTTC